MDIRKVRNEDGTRNGTGTLVSPYDGEWCVIWDDGDVTNEWQADIIIEGVNDDDHPWDNEVVPRGM